MKKNKRAISFEKIKIAKLENFDIILGGQEPFPLTTKERTICFDHCNSTLTRPIGTGN